MGVETEVNVKLTQNLRLSLPNCYVGCLEVKHVFATLPALGTYKLFFPLREASFLVSEINIYVSEPSIFVSEGNIFVSVANKLFGRARIYRGP